MRSFISEKMHVCWSDAETAEKGDLIYDFTDARSCGIVIIFDIYF